MAEVSSLATRISGPVLAGGLSSTIQTVPGAESGASFVLPVGPNPPPNTVGPVTVGAPTGLVISNPTPIAAPTPAPVPQPTGTPEARPVYTLPIATPVIKPISLSPIETSSNPVTLPPTSQTIASIPNTSANPGSSTVSGVDPVTQALLDTLSSGLSSGGGGSNGVAGDIAAGTQPAFVPSTTTTTASGGSSVSTAIVLTIIVAVGAIGYFLYSRYKEKKGNKKAGSSTDEQ